MNSPTPASEDTKDDSPEFQPCFRKIEFPAVASALCCGRTPAPADEQRDKHAHDVNERTPRSLR